MLPDYRAFRNLFSYRRHHMSLLLNPLVCGLTDDSFDSDSNSISISAVRRLLTVRDDQHWAAGRIDDVLGDGADDEIHDAVPAVGAHDDQIRSNLFGNLHDGMFGLAAVQQVIHVNVIGVQLVDDRLHLFLGIEGDMLVFFFHFVDADAQHLPFLLIHELFVNIEQRNFGTELVGDLYGFFDSLIGTLFQVDWAKNMLEHAIAPFCRSGGWEFLLPILPPILLQSADVKIVDQKPKS